MRQTHQRLAYDKTWKTMEWTEVIKLKVIKQWSKPLVARARDISETLSLAESQHCAEKLKWRISEKKKNLS